HRADLGGQERQAGGPPRHAPPGEEEVVGVVLAAGERDADDDEDRERDEKNRVVRPGQRRSGRWHSRIIRDLHASGRLLKRGGLDPALAKLVDEPPVRRLLVIRSNSARNVATKDTPSSKTSNARQRPSRSCRR